MKEYTVKLTETRYRETTVVVRAESESDAEDLATDLYYQDDGCHGVRDRMEHAGSLIDFKVESEAPLGTAETVSEPF